MTLGHPCCSIHNCSQPLINNRHQFCNEHRRFERQCCVVNCERPKVSRQRTCDLVEHIAIETEYTAKGKGFFTLRERLRAQGVQMVNDSNATDGPSADDDYDEIPQRSNNSTDAGNTAKSNEGNRQPKARFGRRRTHNEQVVVACCGVITGRATMFGAESVSGVVVCFHCYVWTFWDNLSISIVLY